MKSLLAVTFSLLSALSVSAQESDWSFQANGYLWLPTTNVTASTPRGDVLPALSVSDALEALDFAAMGTFEARKDRLGLVADLLYLNITGDGSTPLGGLFDTVSIGTKITSVSALALYRVQDTGSFALDLGAGARMMWLDADVRLRGGALPPETITRDDNWIDPIMALRARVNFNEKWYGTLYLDAGGFGVGSEETYQAIADLGYSVNERWSLLGGWRYLDFERENNGNTLDLQKSGVLPGASYRV